jgi:hypothetical protein
MCLNVIQVQRINIDYKLIDQIIIIEHFKNCNFEDYVVLVYVYADVSLFYSIIHNIFLKNKRFYTIIKDTYV